MVNLREFGTLVWVLLQGQKEPRKMESKSRQRIFVGYDDGSNSVKYYNPETRKVLTSRNFRFLSLSNDPSPLEPIAIMPGPSCEGEGERDTPMSTGSKEGDSLKRKREEEENQNRQRRTRGIRIDYRYLQNPFPDEEEEANEASFSSDEELFAIIAGDELKSLKEAKSSPDWPEWEKAIQAELTQLQQMGTWRLVEKPQDAIPIANKWVFLKKRNKSSQKFLSKIPTISTVALTLLLQTTKIKNLQPVAFLTCVVLSHRVFLT